MTSEQFIAVDYLGRSHQLEYAWVNRDAPDNGPLLLFLHEGLGCVRLWRQFPEQLCTALGCRGLVYSRAGYGQSTPLPANLGWPLDYLEQQATIALPALLAALGLDAPDVAKRLWLIGHSDGGSIALLFAAAFPQRLAGMAVMAPHIFVEAVTVSGVAQAKAAYDRDDQWRTRLARYHRDPDAVFRGWNDTWTDPAFRDWNIESRLPAITCPVLAIQGVDDEYATLAQIHGIARHAPQTVCLALPECGHSPHLAQTEAVTAAIQDFIASRTPVL